MLSMKQHAMSPEKRYHSSFVGIPLSYVLPPLALSLLVTPNPKHPFSIHIILDSLLLDRLYDKSKVIPVVVKYRVVLGKSSSFSFQVSYWNLCLYYLVDRSFSYVV